MYRSLAEADLEKRDLKSVRAWLSGADAMPVELIPRFKKAGNLVAFFIEVGLTSALVQGVLFGKLAPRLGERRLLLIGLFGMALGIGGVPFLTSGAALYAWTFILAFSNSLFAPAATGLVSVYAGPTEQGTVLGSAQAIAALGRSLGPLALGLAYDRVRNGSLRFTNHFDVARQTPSRDDRALRAQMRGPLLTAGKVIAIEDEHLEGVRP